MLKNVPKNVSADLIKILMEMGHGDQILIADGNFPTAKNHQKSVSCIGLGTEEVLDSVLSLIPLDSFVDYPTTLMNPVDPNAPEPPIWAKYEQIAKKHEKDGLRAQKVERFDFYDIANSAYAVITTSELSHYACIVLKKGVF